MLSILTLPLLLAPIFGGTAAEASALQDAPSQDEARDYQFASGKSFEVYGNWRLEGTGDALAEQAVVFADRVAELLSARTGLQLAAEGEEAPLALINLYQRPKDLGQVRKGMGLEPDSGAPFCEPGGLTAHVAVQPAVANLLLRAQGIPPWVLCVIGEQAGHSWVERAAPGQWAGAAGWAWNGLVLNAVQTALLESGKALEPEHDPLLGWEGSQMQRQRDAGLGIAELLGLALEDGAGRATRRVLAKALAAPEGQSLGQVLSQGDPLAQLADPSSLLDAQQASFVGWELNTPSIAPLDDGWLQSTRGGTSSRCWSVAPVGREKFKLTARVILYAPLMKPSKSVRPPGQTNLLLGRIGEDYISVTFNTISGLTVFNYQSLTGEYRVLVKQTGGLHVPTNVPFEFSVSIDKELGVVTLNGNQVATFSTSGRDMSGLYGMGAQAGCGTTHWLELKVEQKLE
ncbi:MAG: hypothetical protein ACI8QC_003077 [Planctomycetota bacterium]|jgi:hypothetical protein